MRWSLLCWHSSSEVSRKICSSWWLTVVRQEQLNHKLRLYLRQNKKKKKMFRRTSFLCRIIWAKPGNIIGNNLNRQVKFKEILTLKLVLPTILVTGKPLRKEELLPMWLCAVKTAVSFPPLTRDGTDEVESPSIVSCPINCNHARPHIDKCKEQRPSYSLLAVEHRWHIFMGCSGENDHGEAFHDRY